MSLITFQEDVPDIIDALNRLVQALVGIFGIWGFVGLLFLICIAFTIWRLYNDKRKDRDADQALKEKDRSIQRLADECRMWRALFLKDKAGWTDEQVRAFVNVNEFPDAQSARKALEGQEASDTSKPAKSLPRKKK